MREGGVDPPNPYSCLFCLKTFIFISKKNLHKTDKGGGVKAFLDASIQYLSRNILPKGRASKKSKKLFFIDPLPKPSRSKTRPLRPKMVVIFYAFSLPYQHRIRLVAVLLLALALRATRTSHRNTSKSSLSNIQTFIFIFIPKPAAVHI